MRRGIGILLLVFAWAAGTAHAANGPTIQGYIPMSDGVTLAYQVVLPDPASLRRRSVPDAVRLLRLRAGPHGQLQPRRALRLARLRDRRREHPRDRMLGRQVRLLRGAPVDRRRRGRRVARRTGLERRPDRDGQQVVSRYHPALRRGAAARAPRGDRTGPRLRRPVPRRALPRRDHERDLLRRLEPGRAAVRLDATGAPGRRRRRSGVRCEPGRARRERALQPVRPGVRAPLRRRPLPRPLAVRVRRPDRGPDPAGRGVAGRAGRLARDEPRRAIRPGHRLADARVERRPTASTTRRRRRPRSSASSPTTSRRRATRPRRRRRKPITRPSRP